MKLPNKPIFSRRETGNLCYMAARFGYKVFSDWVINNVPEAAYLISSYIQKHPEDYKEFFENDLRDSEHVLEKSEGMMRRLEHAKNMGEEPEESKYLK